MLDSSSENKREKQGKEYRNKALINPEYTLIIYKILEGQFLHSDIKTNFPHLTKQEFSNRILYLKSKNILKESKRYRGRGTHRVEYIINFSNIIEHLVNSLLGGNFREELNKLPIADQIILDYAVIGEDIKSYFLKHPEYKHLCLLELYRKFVFYFSNVDMYRTIEDFDIHIKNRIDNMIPKSDQGIVDYQTKEIDKSDFLDLSQEILKGLGCSSDEISQIDIRYELNNFFNTTFLTREYQSRFYFKVFCDGYIKNQISH